MWLILNILRKTYVEYKFYMIKFIHVVNINNWCFDKAIAVIITLKFKYKINLNL